MSFSINTPDAEGLFQLFSGKGMCNKGLFLDRDGVINIDYGYVHQIENFQFVDGIFDLVKKANVRGYLVFVVTNQSGIGRGYYSEDQFQHLCKWMLEQFESRDCDIKKIYYSPCHPTEALGPYLKDDHRRKPRPGMILQAREEFAVDLSKSILIGDNLSDIQAGLGAGIGTNVLLGKDFNDGSFETASSLKNALRFLE